jgi:hypothetical protein
MTSRSRILLALAAVWGTAAISGLSVLAHYSANSGVASVARDWPAGTGIDRPRDRFFLLIFVHPDCPCSEATLEELNRLRTKAGEHLAVTIVFSKPTATEEDLRHTTLWNQASVITNVKLMADIGGAEAARFDASTSGQVLLFDATGRLRFRGGITASRGHAGDNDGEDCIIAILAGSMPPIQQTPVYGCRLFDASSPLAKGHTCKR